MYKLLIAFLIVFFVGVSYDTYAQDSGQRTRELASALDKTKYKKKEKANISIEFYIDIKNEPAIREPAAYSGTYEADGYQLSLNVGSDGSASGSGYDMNGPASGRGNFTLRNARVEGALLTATKVYEDGRLLPFEAVFANRTVSTGKNAEKVESRETHFGLGFIQSDNINWTNRVFLERR